MSKLVNPIITGFNPDPVIFKDEDKYYIMVSTFEWLPGIRVYSSSNFTEWHYETSILTDSRLINLQGNPRGGSIWAPFATYHKGKYYVVYTNTNSTNVPYKDVDNYIIYSDNIHGPWSKPVYINSSGFDPSIYFDDDNRAYFINEIWDYRLQTHNKSCGIVMQEINPSTFELLGSPRKIFNGTEAQKTEAPQIYKHHNFYYLLTAEGGTEKNHQETVARSKNIWGPYEVDPNTPLITSKDDRSISLKSAGHASLVQTTFGDWYIAYLCTRPFNEEDAILGRETSIQKVYWTEDDWLRLSNGSNRPNLEVELPTHCTKPHSVNHSFTDSLKDPLSPKHWNTLRQFANPSWITNTSEGLVIKGGQSPQSNFDQHLIATRQCDFKANISVKMQYQPQSYLQLAGLTLYLDTNNYLLFMLTANTQNNPCVVLQKSKDGIFEQLHSQEISNNTNYRLSIKLDYKKANFSIVDNLDVINLGSHDISFLSGGFTGNFIGLDVIDMYRRNYTEAKFFDFVYEDND